MKIKMLTSMSGPTVQRNRGDEVDVPAPEASRLIEAGFAEPVGNAPREKATSRSPRETRNAALDQDGEDLPPAGAVADPVTPSAEDGADAAQAETGAGE